MMNPEKINAKETKVTVFQEFEPKFWPESGFMQIRSTATASIITDDQKPRYV